ncbi:TetR/AcrR family transcriptional regulator [Nocardia miyunensis]|uniref:TetR/AcrR family transcriptional regulator n=1 Tax=Nocardia miyunensis TaxID=282684 RepID=UPI000AA6ADEA|nr:TetR/AcrR family transcriptional regulator [Nocardia miyunensis]
MTTPDSSLRPDDTPSAPWADRAADRSRAVQRSRARSMAQAETIVAAAQRLILTVGSSFTTQDLAKEAGIALQTFYRHFAGKDQLLLAVFENIVGEWTIEIERAARGLPDPIARLRFYIVSALDTLRGDVGDGPRFVTAEHWRLYQLFPDEIAHANQSVADLIERELRAAEAAGLIRPRDAATDSWLAMKLVMAVFHHCAFASKPDTIDDVAEYLWSFCLAAFGGSAPD